MRISIHTLIAAVVFASLLGGDNFAGEAKKVTATPTPNNGLNPQVMVDAKGVVHLIYSKGDSGKADLFYVKSTDGGATWSSELKVNSGAGSVIIAGTIRGPRLALGKDSRVHVAWMGSAAAEPKGPNNANPMLYTRLSDDGKSFEPQRNLIQEHYGLDGGGALAADSAGNVYVFWHGMGDVKGEVGRRVYVAVSTDDGKTFAKEKPAIAEQTGACACCGMNALADAKGNIYVLYRGAQDGGNERDIFMLVSKDKGATFQGADVSQWKLQKCAMSTSYLAETPKGVLAAWEVRQTVQFGFVGSNFAMGTPFAPLQLGRNPKNPAAAANANGETLASWTEGTSFNQGGSVGWQLYDKSGTPGRESGKAEGLPANSLVAVFAKPDGTFVILH